MPLDILPSLNVKLFLINPPVIPSLLALYASLGDLVSKVSNVFFCCILFEKQASDYLMAR